ncbi:MAG: hypothetical protein EOP83_01890 [Verrucomicrobiaceae bacterium]|nr:MAG: hypothetical protein EOP83_01890 [Verrucomicrobiaceae bacterium]
MSELRFDLLACDPGFPCRFFAIPRPNDIRDPDTWVADRSEGFEVVYDWCEQNLGSNLPLTRWVGSHPEKRVYFYNETDAMLFKIRWC